MTPDLDQIADALARREPVMAAPPDDPWTHAAVALILHRSERGVELLLIERARRDGDHWSGDMAFPGGRSIGSGSTAAADCLTATLCSKCAWILASVVIGDRCPVGVKSVKAGPECVADPF